LHSSQASDGSDAGQTRGKSELETLREILLARYTQRLAELEAELDDVERHISDEEALIATVAPVLGEAIRRRIRDAREEMIESLYPIIGQVVVRAVSEAIRDLARTVDAQVRGSFSPRLLWWRLRARIGGASSEAMSLRESLPFDVAEVFLIHRQTGLLLWHVSRQPESSVDSDLVGSMLTAIRDFAQDAFGQGKEGHLDEIEYGDRRILTESAQHAYLAAVVDGIEPPGFRALMRERLLEVEHAHPEMLREYDGDPAPLSSVDGPLRTLLAPASPAGLSAGQKRILVGLLGLVFVCLLTVCWGSTWVLRKVRATPTPTAAPVIVHLTPSPTPSPTSTPSPTHTPTSTLTPTAVRTPTSTSTPSPVVGLMTGNVWVRQAPSPDAPLMGVILQRGQLVEIQAVFGDWCQVRWTPEAQTEVVGWVPLEWVGTTIAIPSRLVTPVLSP
jgi:hypothetical protein